jgi:hypothetical protein
MIVFKVMRVPVRLLFGTAKVSAKAGYKTAKTGAVVGAKTVVGSAKMGYSAGRAVGYGRTAVFAAGVAVGVLVASPQARAGVGRIGSTLWAMRRRSKGPSDAEIAEQVRRRLAGAGATWQLPQPTVTVVDGRVRLDGDAPDAGGRRAMAETASEVQGVRELDNRVVVAVDAGRGSDAEGPSAAAVADDGPVGSSAGGNGAAATA